MRYDAVICGGGLVGATLALALGSAGLRVAVIERTGAPAAPPGPTYGLRVSTFTVASERVLRALGVWAILPPERVGPMREMHVWERTGSVHFDAAEIGEPVLGHVIENAVVQWALERRLDTLPNVDWYRAAELEGLAVGDDGAVAELPGRRLRAPLVVGADGADSQVRALVGIDAEAGDYGQRALVAEVRTAVPHGATAWQRFLPGGPLAFLPLANGASSMVWSTTPEHARHLGALDAGAFGDAVADALDWKLGAVTAQSDRASFALRHLHASAYVRNRIALAGDAAHIVHPLAGQGVNLGLLDAAALADVVGRARQRGRDIGARATLRRYERWRRGHNALTKAVLGGFHHLFTSPWRSVRQLREAGFSLTDRLAPVKAGIMRFASGIDGDLPALARYRHADTGSYDHPREPRPESGDPRHP